MSKTNLRNRSEFGLKTTILSIWAIIAVLLSSIGVWSLWCWITTPAQAQGNSALPILATATQVIQTLPGTATSHSLTPSPEQKNTTTSDRTSAPTQIAWMEGPTRIGFSVSRRPLEIFRFGTGRTRRLIVAGIHGGSEWNTISLANELIAYLQNHPEIVPSDITLYILSDLNPDGEARAHDVDGRVNDNGVDLNRNWPNNWKSEWTTTGCWGYRPLSAGPYPASEPETIYLMNFILWHGIDALISYHSAGLGIFAGGRPSFEPSNNLAKAIAKSSDYPHPPINTGCEYTGTLADWAAAQGIAAIDIELTNHYETDFDQNIKILKVFLNWKR